jgi:hypothetical protein
MDIAHFGIENHGSLAHDFYLIYVEDSAALERAEFFPFIASVPSETKTGVNRVIAQECVQDEIINYFIEYIMWIPLKNTWGDGRNKGINRWGATIYNKDSAELLINLLSGIKSLFLYAPECIKLRFRSSSFCVLEDGKIKSVMKEGKIKVVVEEGETRGCRYEHFFLNKQESLVKINHLIEMVEYLREPHYIILHSGI